MQPGPGEPAHRAHGGAGAGHPGGRRLGDPWNEVMHLADQVAAARTLVPAWRRPTRGEHRWPVTVTVIVAVVLQIRLSDSLTRPLPHLLLPLLEVALGVGLAIVNPVRIERASRVTRAVSLALIVLITAANAISAILLIHAILTQEKAASAGALLASGAAVWATNVIAFGLWYWEFDRGGPVARTVGGGTMRPPDFLFPQMGLAPDLVPRNWEPHFIDYLYLSFTNATAFSPTDVMPMARWAKCTMAVQSGVALLVGVLVIARAINIL
jgi:hypothetical protein